MIVTIDTSGLRGLASRLDGEPSRIAREVRASLVLGAVHIKGQMRAEMQASRHFRGVASSITFDLIESPTGLTAEIGPEATSGSPGNLANIAHFGSSRGGGTVPDPVGALNAEEPRFEAAVLAILARAL